MNVVHQELADDGIRTVGVAPGLTDAPGMSPWSARSTSHGRRPVPAGGSAGPGTSWRWPTFLCSDAASHLSGTVPTVRPPVYR